MFMSCFYLNQETNQIRNNGGDDLCDRKRPNWSRLLEHVPDVWIDNERVLRLAMTSQVNFPLERTPTTVAREGFETSVFPAVGNEIRWLAKRLATLQTFMWFLTCNEINKWWY